MFFMYMSCKLDINPNKTIRQCFCFSAAAEVITTKPLLGLMGPAWTIAKNEKCNWVRLSKKPGWIQPTVLVFCQWLFKVWSTFHFRHI